MESNGRGDSAPIKKQSFRFKNDKNGLVLTAHHTVTEDGGKVVRVRFVTACFGENNVHLAVVDHRGNVFIFDLSSKKFWKLKELAPKSSVILNIPGSTFNYIVGTKDGKILVIDTKNGEIINSRRFSHYRIESISFSESSQHPNIFVLHSIQEAFLVNLNDLKTTHKLEFNENKISLKFVGFMPKCDKIFSCFTNDSVHIWSGSTLNTVHIIHPIRLRDRWIKHKNVPEVAFTTAETDLDLIFKSAVKDYTRGLIKSVSFSLDCRFICLTTIDDFIIIINRVSYHIDYVLKLKTVSCFDITFAPQGGDLTLFALTSTSDVILIDCSGLAIKVIVQDGKSYRIGSGKNGKMLFVILKTGEINIYNTTVTINALKSAQSGVENIKESKGVKSIETGLLDKEFKRILSKDRLTPILKEYGQYPEKYRHLIWSSLLDLPCNKTKFGELAKKGIHPAVGNYDQQFPLKDVSALRHLKKMVSSLIHWCSVFAHCDFLPSFVFPFIKIFPNSALLTFELLSTIIWNYCQLWFEFTPLEPLNYLGMIENLLEEFDSQLYCFYTRKRITAKTYAWTLMSSAFSEVLDESQWYQLWDNVLSNQPYYLVFCIVGYNIAQKSVLMSIERQDSIEEFFHEQNIIDMRKFLRRVGLLMDQCPQSIHPKRYMKKFASIPKGFYPKFENYPKKWVEIKDNEMETLRIERELLDKKIRELEKAEISLARRLEDGLKQEEHQKRMKEVEKLYGEALSREEERIACQRKMLLLYQKQIRARKAQVIDLVRESTQRKNVTARENELDTLMRAIERGRNRDEADMIFADEEIKIREMNLVGQKYEIEATLTSNEPFTRRFKSAIDRLEDERKRLTSELKNIRKDDGDTQDTLTRKINSIERMLQQIQVEFIKTIQPRSGGTSAIKLKDLEAKTNYLEEEVNNLLQRI